MDFWLDLECQKSPQKRSFGSQFGDFLAHFFRVDFGKPFLGAQGVIWELQNTMRGIEPHFWGVWEG